MTRPIASVVIHAVYLINCAPARSGRSARKSLASLKQALRVGDGIGADGVVLHAGARKGEPHAPSVKRAGKVIREALESSDRCPVLLENTAGTNGPLGKNFDELAELVEAAGGGKRLGDLPRLLPPVRGGLRHLEPRGVRGGRRGATTRRSALERLRCVHVNDSKVPLGREPRPPRQPRPGRARPRGSARVPLRAAVRGAAGADRDPGPEGHGPDRKEVLTAKRLRREGLKQRG